MKVSEKDKARTRIKILEAAVDIISEKGFKSASMREIARHAKVGDATIYNYFPSKEKLLYGYCEHVQQQVMESLKQIDDFHEYTLQEQLQQFAETQLQTWLPAREFLQEVFKLTYYSPVAGSTHLRKTKTIFTQMISNMMETAIEAGEIPEQPYQELLPRLYWDYMTGVMAYWLKDDSDDFSNTTQLIDKSMDIIASILHQGIIAKSLDLMSFLFRSHVIRHFDDLGKTREAGKFIKRHFMSEETTETTPPKAARKATQNTTKKEKGE